jgi:hypothetical protein
VCPDLSVPELEVHADGTDLEVKDDTKPVTQADEFEKAKALKVTMESAVAKVLHSLWYPRHWPVCKMWTEFLVLAVWDKTAWIGPWNRQPQVYD